MAIDAAGWRGPWWEAVRKAYEIPGVVTDQHAAEIIAARLAEEVKDVSNNSQWEEALMSGEKALGALMDAAIEGALDHALCGSPEVSFGGGNNPGRHVTDPRNDAIEAIEKRAKPIQYREVIAPLWDIASHQIWQDERES